MKFDAIRKRLDALEQAAGSRGAADGNQAAAAQLALLNAALEALGGAASQAGGVQALLEIGRRAQRGQLSPDDQPVLSALPAIHLQAVGLDAAQWFAFMASVDDQF